MTSFLLGLMHYRPSGSTLGPGAYRLSLELRFGSLHLAQDELTMLCRVGAGMTGIRGSLSWDAEDE
jgi:hypothetical protein